MPIERIERTQWALTGYWKKPAEQKFFHRPFEKWPGLALGKYLATCRPCWSGSRQVSSFACTETNQRTTYTAKSNHALTDIQWSREISSLDGSGTPCERHQGEDLHPSKGSANGCRLNLSLELDAVAFRGAGSAYLNVLQSFSSEWCIPCDSSPRTRIKPTRTGYINGRKFFPCLGLPT